MSINSSQYIYDIDRTGVTPSVNEVFTIPFEYPGEEALAVWTVVAGVYTRKVAGIDYEVLATTVKWIGTAPSVNMRFQRAVLYNQPSQLEKTSNNSIEKAVDELCMRGQQQLKPDPLDPRHLSAEGDSIENVTSNSGATYAANKSDVDDSFGVDTPTHSNWSLSTSDVGKYYQIQADGSSAAWSAFDGTADPMGQEGKYLTGTGWTELGEIPAVGTATHLLKDVSGTPTWSAATEIPSGSSFGQILTRTAVPAPAWRSSGYTPTPLTENRFGLVRANSTGTRNEWDGRFFMSTHNVSFDNDVGCNGGGEWMGPEIKQHRVWYGSITHANGVPTFLKAQTAGVWMHEHFAAPHYGSPVNDNEALSRVFPTPILLNTISVGATTVELAASTWIHRWVRTAKGASAAYGNWMWGNGVLATAETSSPTPATITVPVTIMWYYE